MSDADFDTWSAGRNYEHYMGRWSRRIATAFLEWLAPPARSRWIEFGCGTGALTDAILSRCAPAAIVATDLSADFVDHARRAITDPRATFAVADAMALPAADASMDVVTSALAFNFVPDRVAALTEMQRVLRPGGILSFYVWDYPGGGMGFIDAFWKAAAQLDDNAAGLDEGGRFPFCTPYGLRALCQQAGITDPRIEALEVMTEFPDFEAFWHPFTLGAGPAPGYCASLPEDSRAELKARLAQTLGSDGPIRLPARAWAMQSQVR